MPKKCKNCGTAVEDTTRICPSCSNLAFEQTAKFELSSEQLQELAKVVSENLTKKPRVLWGVTWRVGLLVFALLGIPGAITGWNIWSSFDDFKNTTTKNIETQFRLLNQSSSNQIVKAYSDITNDVAVKFEIFAQEANTQIASAYSSVTNQIADQFQEPRVQQTVESVAKGEAKIIFENEVRPVVEEFHANVEGKLKAIENGEDFLELANKARAHDYQAYLSLRDLSTQTDAVGNSSSRVTAEIDRAMEEERAGFTHMSLSESVGANHYSGPFTSDEIARDLNSANSSSGREGIVNAVRDLHQPLFLGKLIEWFTNETDLMVADREALAISEITKEDFHPRDLDQVKLWWNTNKIAYTNWPYAEFNQGLIEFSYTDFSDAAKLFEQVLKLDSVADMSRALAIACYWETGETNKAMTSAKQFNNSSGRWAQWAAAKAQLETGDITNATIQLANIYTNYPTMIARGFVQEGFPVWRKVDWQLFKGKTVQANQ
jgi:tetratricopeptide (TPR) repeat protein